MAVIGAAVAFAANALSPRGLQLSKNYFPGANLVSPNPSIGSNGAATAAQSVPISEIRVTPQNVLSARLQADGLQLAESNQVIQFFRDPRREQDGVIFIDARNEEHYRMGHIPGAYLFDRFQQENYITNVLQVCITAQQIVFYCNGGDCDDSEHAAIMLRDGIGIPKEKVFVYGGGISEWTANGFPIELGPRNSGQLTNLVQTPTGPKAGVSKP